jgi:hypothetical protein
MKTAVEWLYDQIENEGNCIYEVMQQAKEMEKEQIIKAYDRGYNEYDIYRNGQNYYNETFKSL